jgi:hypothetical protein
VSKIEKPDGWPDEVWRSIPGTDGRYEASSGGRIRHIVRGVMTPKFGTRPYLQVSPYIGRRRKNFYVHTLVAMAFHGPRPDGMECRHLNGVCTDNRPSNLAWGTRGENVADMLRHGTQVKGRRVNTAKLTEADVLAIRQSPETLTALGRRYGVTIQSIQAIRQRKSWRHI